MGSDTTFQYCGPTACQKVVSDPTLLTFFKILDARMTHSSVLTTIDDRGVATITLNRPDKHNAFDDRVIADLTAAFQAVSEDRSVRVMVLAAQGKSFSAGADLGWMQRMTHYSYDENLRDANALANMLKSLNSLPVPTIARVQGAAFGGAVGLVSCCDMAVGTARASFSLSEVKIGLVPATISPYVIGAVGARAARRYFLTAERFDAQTALHLGLLSEVVEEKDLDSAIEKLIVALRGNGPQAITMAKQLVYDVAHRPVDDALIQQTSELIAQVRVSAEGQEGLSAFLEKRQAGWIG